MPISMIKPKMIHFKNLILRLHCKTQDIVKSKIKVNTKLINKNCIINYKANKTSQILEMFQEKKFGKKKFNK